MSIKRTMLLDDTILLVADFDDNNGSFDRTFYKEGALPICPCNESVTVDVEESKITVTAKTYVHALQLEGHAIFSDNCFMLLPGESKTVTYQKTEDTADITYTAHTIEDLV